MTVEPLHPQAAWLDAVGPPDDLYDPEDSHPPRFLSEEDLYDDLPPMSRVDGLEWELWAGVDQDEAEREMLRLKAPAWVFLPPGAELAAALESVRPQCESPIALIELMKAASRMVSWLESIKADAMASFVRQRKAQLAEIPRPTQIDTSGRPIDPERSWTAESRRRATSASPRTPPPATSTTALHLTGPLAATHTALRCGALTWSKALSISETTRHLPDDAAQAVESHVLRRAASQTHANLRKSLRRQVAKHCAAEESNRHREAVRRPHLQNRAPARRHGRPLGRPHRRQDPANVGRRPSHVRPRQTRHLFGADRQCRRRTGNRCRRKLCGRSIARGNNWCGS